MSGMNVLKVVVNRRGFHGLRYCTSRIFARRKTVNKEYYLGVMRRLREAVRQKRKDLWANNSWILHHDNAPSHSTIIIREFLIKNKTNTIQQPSNSPDMAPCDFFLFDRVKKRLRGTRFNSRKEVMEKSKTALTIPTIEFQKCFESWIKL